MNGRRASLASSLLCAWMHRVPQLNSGVSQPTDVYANVTLFAHRERAVALTLAFVLNSACHPRSAVDVGQLDAFFYDLASRAWCVELPSLDAEEEQAFGTAGFVRLPARFERVGGEEAGGALGRWRAPDSAEVLVWVGATPIAGLASVGGGGPPILERLELPGYQLELACRAAVGERPALVDRFFNFSESRRDTVFGVIVESPVRPGLVVSGMAFAHGAAARDSLAGALLRMRLSQE